LGGRRGRLLRTGDGRAAHGDLSDQRLEPPRCEHPSSLGLTRADHFAAGCRSARSVDTTPPCRYHYACTVVSARRRCFGVTTWLSAAAVSTPAWSRHPSVVSALQHGFDAPAWFRRSGVVSTMKLSVDTSGPAPTNGPA